MKTDRMTESECLELVRAKCPSVQHSLDSSRVGEFEHSYIILTNMIGGDLSWACSAYMGDAEKLCVKLCEFLEKRK